MTLEQQNAAAIEELVSAAFVQSYPWTSIQKAIKILEGKDL